MKKWLILCFIPVLMSCSSTNMIRGEDYFCKSKQVAQGEINDFNLPKYMITCLDEIGKSYRNVRLLTTLLPVL
jgi:hypothetical protein